jgi:hypothetical protein
MFKLNQIQMDIRRKLSEETKDDKVHKKENTNVNNNKSTKPFVDEAEVETKEKKNKRFLTINGEKHNSKYIEVKVEKNQESIGELSSGMFIDKMK